MSRQRNNFIINKESLPDDIKFIINRNKDNNTLNNKSGEESIINIDKSLQTKINDGNVVFFKKPKFEGISKEYANKEDPKVKLLTLYFPN